MPKNRLVPPHNDSRPERDYNRLELHSYEYIKFCVSCWAWKEKTFFDGQKRLSTYCKSCRSKKYYDKPMKPVKNKMAYNFVIKNRYTGELYKYNENEIPSGYEIVYRRKAGYLLPQNYGKLKEYVEGLGQTNTNESG